MKSLKKNEREMEYDAVIMRIQEKTPIRSQSQLAHYLGVKQSEVSDVRRRASFGIDLDKPAIPASWLLTLLRKDQLNPDWVLTGEGAVYLVPSDSPNI